MELAAEAEYRNHRDDDSMVDHVLQRKDTMRRWVVLGALPLSLRGPAHGRHVAA